MSGSIAIEKFLMLNATPKHGTLVAGERARPPEDVSGVSGHERFLEIIADRDDPEHADAVPGSWFSPSA
jgi:hypothetical protein